VRLRSPEKLAVRARVTALLPFFLQAPRGEFKPYTINVLQRLPLRRGEPCLGGFTQRISQKTGPYLSVDIELR
jgi:hypothetical protein